jgi:hypothetical protein
LIAGIAVIEEAIAPSTLFRHKTEGGWDVRDQPPELVVQRLLPPGAHLRIHRSAQRSRHLGLYAAETSDHPAYLGGRPSAIVRWRSGYHNPVASAASNTEI